MNCQQKFEMNGKKVSILEMNISNMDMQPFFVNKMLPKNSYAGLNQHTGIIKSNNCEFIKRN